MVTRTKPDPAVVNAVLAAGLPADQAKELATDYARHGGDGCGSCVLVADALAGHEHDHGSEA